MSFALELHPKPVPMGRLFSKEIEHLPEPISSAIDAVDTDTKPFSYVSRWVPVTVTGNKT